MKKQRWTCIDILKCLAALAVVEIHKPLKVQSGAELLILCRFAVPVFFMITGFFYSETVAHRRELKQIGKILTITIGANLFYLIWKVLLALEDENNIKDALLARFEERMPEDFICGIFPTVPTFVVFTGACVCAGDRIYCRTFRLKEACISGNSGTVGRKPDKGKLFSAPSGKRLLPCLLCEKFSVLWPALFLAGLPVWREKRSFGGLSRQKENDIAFGRYSGFLEHGTYGAKMAYENECSWNRRRVWWNHFSGSLYLPSFYRMAEFL